MALLPPYRILTIKSIKEATYKEIMDKEFKILWGKTKQNIPFNRVKISGFITNTYLSADKKYGFIIVDDGTESIMVKFFKDALQINNLNKGDLVVVSGRISNYNNEIHIINERTRVFNDMKEYFLIYRLDFINTAKFFSRLKEDIEIKGYKGEDAIKYITSNYNFNEQEILVFLDMVEETLSTPTLESKEDVKKAVLEYMQQNSTDDGIDYTQIVKDLPYEEEEIEKAIVELLSEGTCYEPRPGILKLL